MKKLPIGSLILFIVAALLAVAFAALLIVDCVKYYPYGSAPFYAYVLVRGIEFLLPAAILLIVGLIVRKKAKK